jgi:hypothetical protein
VWKDLLLFLKNPILYIRNRVVSLPCTVRIRKTCEECILDVHYMHWHGSSMPLSGFSTTSAFSLSCSTGVE